MNEPQGLSDRARVQLARIFVENVRMKDALAAIISVCDKNNSPSANAAMALATVRAIADSNLTFCDGQG
jgi:hypothetical protein